MKRKIGWLAVLTVVAYGVVTLLSPLVSGAALQSVASAVWGN
jgi:hypothetical protein